MFPVLQAHKLITYRPQTTHVNYLYSSDKRQIVLLGSKRTRELQSLSISIQLSK